VPVRLGTNLTADRVVRWLDFCEFAKGISGFGSKCPCFFAELGWKLVRFAGFFGSLGAILGKVGFKKNTFLHFLRRFSTFLREIEKNNSFLGKIKG